MAKRRADDRSLEEWANEPWMHIHAQYIWHGDATISGTRVALMGLRDAIDKCLSTGMESRSIAITADGEGYSVVVNIRDLASLEKDSLPYTADFARGR